MCTSVKYRLSGSHSGLTCHRLHQEPLKLGGGRLENGASIFNLKTTNPVSGAPEKTFVTPSGALDAAVTQKKLHILLRLQTCLACTL